MATQTAENIVQSALDNTAIEQPDVDSGGIGVIGWLAKAGEMAPPWWSPSRDQFLSNYWKGANHLSIALYNAQSKLAAIPFQIEARDHSVMAHVQRAEEVTMMLSLSEFGAGISVSFERFFEDVLTQDNGGFLEIIADEPEGTPKDGPLRGPAFNIRHLDAQRCVRTNSPTYPVTVYDNGKSYKLHWTRVISYAQMHSSRRGLNGVGYCALSRAVDIAQTAVDVVRYKQERLGSRPLNQLILGKGIRAQSIMKAIRMAENQMDSRGLNRYSRTIAIGSESADVDLQTISLNHLDPFNEKDTITLAMFAIAGAFGIDVTEIWPVAGAGGGGTDAARMQNMRARGKLPAQITDFLATQFNLKFLPPYLKMKFDFRDDEEDQQRAIIADIRGRRRERDIGSGTLSVRGARVIMMRDGDIDRPLFEELELASGRLEDGTPISALFFNPEYAVWLNLGLGNPLDFENLDIDAARIAAANARAGIYAATQGTRARTLVIMLRRATAALDWYEGELDKHQIGQELEETPPAEQVTTPPDEEELEQREEEDMEGAGTSSMGRQRRSRTQK
jgi:hypothetical protein